MYKRSIHQKTGSAPESAADERIVKRKHAGPAEVAGP
jgi:hypothetical protein